MADAKADDTDPVRQYERWRLGDWACVTIALSIVIALYWANYWLGWKSGILNDNTRGIAGDAFGIVNSLFSGLALASIVVTFIFQNRDIKNQISELRQSQEAFRKQMLLNAYLELMHGSRELLTLAVTNPEFAKSITCPGAERWDENKAYYQMWLKSFCAAWLARELGGNNVVDGLAEGERADLIEFFSGNDQLKAHWENVRQVFPKGFQEEVDEAVAAAFPPPVQIRGQHS